MQMTDNLEPPQSLPNSIAPKPEPRQSGPTAAPKSELVKKLLQRRKGATLTELQDATAWQPHSVRAFFSGLRRKGQVLVKEQRKSGETAYRLSVSKVAAASADA